MSACERQNPASAGKMSAIRNPLLEPHRENMSFSDRCAGILSPPSPRTGQLDNRGSQFYLALYWAQALAAQTDDAALAAKFAPLADKLAAGEEAIVAELAAVQGKAADIGGYYQPDLAKLNAVMRPSATLNAALATMQS